MKAKMKDVAEKAQVSIATVSHVINKTRFVKQETRQKVLNAMNELNYHPNYAAKSLRSRKSHKIGLIVPDISNSFYASIVSTIEANLRKKDYNILVSNSNEDIKIEKEQLRILNSQIVEGIIMVPTSGNHSFLKKFLKDKYPILFIDRKPINYRGDCVLTENIKGAYKAVNHLIDKGHSRIGIIKGISGLSSIEERLIGYKRALLDNGIQPDEELIKNGNSLIDSGYRLTKVLLDETDISALFVTNNAMCIGTIGYLKEKGIKIPEEIALISFDDFDWASVTTPSLSVVKQPVNKIADLAVKLMLERINKKNFEFREIRLPTTLVVREST